MSAHRRWVRSLLGRLTKTAAIQQKEPQIQNTFDCSGSKAPSRYGVMNDRSQLKNQLAAVVMDRHFARTFRGNISPVTTHAAGPKVEAKKLMYY